MTSSTGMKHTRPVEKPDLVLYDDGVEGVGEIRLLRREKVLAAVIGDRREAVESSLRRVLPTKEMPPEISLPRQVGIDQMLMHIFIITRTGSCLAAD